MDLKNTAQQLEKSIEYNDKENEDIRKYLSESDLNKKIIVV